MTSSIVCLTVARERNLANAPITEAIIDFRVKHTQGFQVEKFLTLKAELASEFPIIEPRTIVEGAFEIKIGEPIEAKKREELQGYWFKSTDDLNIAQIPKRWVYVQPTQAIYQLGTNLSESMAIMAILCRDWSRGIRYTYCHTVCKPIDVPDSRK
jgi:hypothetical protein